MEDLDTIAIRMGTDKASSHPTGAHNYCGHYDEFFTPLRHQPIKLLEIGVGGGESIRTWLEYFPQADVYGVDNNPDAFKGPLDRYVFVLGDQTSTAFWARFTADYGTDWDVIIDDGGHFSGGIITSFEALWPHVKSGGIYAIEDLQCAYGSIFQSPGFKNHMDFVKDLVDNANKGERKIYSITQSHELAILLKE